MVSSTTDGEGCDILVLVDGIGGTSIPLETSEYEVPAKVGLREFSVGLDVVKVSRMDVEEVVGSAVSVVDSRIDSVVEVSKFLVGSISWNPVVKTALVLGNVTIHVGCTVSVCMAKMVTKGDDLG